MTNEEKLNQDVQAPPLPENMQKPSDNMFPTDTVIVSNHFEVLVHSRSPIESSCRMPFNRSQDRNKG